MKILLIIGNSPYEVYGGAEIFVKEVADELVYRGHEIHVLTGRLGKDVPDVEMINGVTVHKYSFINIPKVRGILAPRSMYTRGESIIKKYGIEIINPYLTWPTGYIGVKLGEKFNIPVVVSSQEIFGKYLKEELSHFYKKKQAKYVFENAHIHVLSKYSKKRLKEVFPQKKDISVIYCGYNDKKFKLNNITKEKHSIICVSNFYKSYCQKRQDILIKCIGLLVNKYPDVRLYFVGGGDATSHEKLVNDLGLDKYISFLGVQSHEKLPELLNKCEIFAFPTESESFGMVAIEAMGCGLPVVVADVPPFREYIKDGVNGLLVPLTPNGFANAISQMLSDEEKRNTLSINALNTARRFTWKETTDKIEKLFYKMSGLR